MVDELQSDHLPPDRLAEAAFCRYLNPMAERPWLSALGVTGALLLLPAGGLLYFAGRAQDPVKPAPAALTTASGTPQAPAPNPSKPPSLRRLRGTVVDEEGAPVPGAVVTAGSKRTSTDAEGRFLLQGLSATSLRITAVGFASASVEAEGSATTVTLTRAAAVEGLVTDGDGEGIARATVRCATEVDDEPREARTDASGQFVLPAAAAGCAAAASKRGYAVGDTVVLREGPGNALQLGRPGAIEGRVVDAKGYPLEGVVVLVDRFRPAGEQQTEAVRIRTRGGRDGDFSLAPLAAGEYVIAAVVEGRPPVTTSPLSLDRGQRLAGVRIEVTAGGVLRGVVTDAETGAPLVGARVRLDAMTMYSRSRVSATTDEGGAYELVGVPEDEPFSVQIAAEGYGAQVVSALRVRAAGERDFELRPGDRTEYSGIGAILGQAGRYISLRRVIEGGPAAEAGLVAGTVVESIDGLTTLDMTQPAAIQKLRGPAGSRVRMKIRNGSGARDVLVTRGRFTHEG
ncbi:MAG: carboxypeptidase regulatory-like domain-containing protein [Myxococcota bacterium]